MKSLTLAVCGGKMMVKIRRLLWGSRREMRRPTLEGLAAGEVGRLIKLVMLQVEPRDDKMNDY